MRIAFCLNGVVGKFYTNKQKYEWSGDVDFRIGHHFFKKNISDVNDIVDVFIHSWDTKYEEQLVEIYQPKKSKFEEQIEFDDTLLRGNFIKSRWYGAKQVTQLKKEYEKENDFTYDVVMSSRFDMGFFEPLKFNEVPDLNMMYIPDNNNPNAQGILDYWYFSSSENMDIINNLYDWNIDRGKFGSPHRDLYEWPTLNNIEICVLSKFQESWRGNGNTDLIRAVFENCEYNEKGFVGIENLRKIRTYPKGTRF